MPASCPFCGRPRGGSSRARAENPYCAACLHERLTLATARSQVFRLIHEGHYVRVERGEAKK